MDFFDSSYSRYGEFDLCTEKSRWNSIIWWHLWARALRVPAHSFSKRWIVECVRNKSQRQNATAWIWIIMVLAISSVSLVLVVDVMVANSMRCGYIYCSTTVINTDGTVSYIDFTLYYCAPYYVQCPLRTLTIRMIAFDLLLNGKIMK